MTPRVVLFRETWTTDGMVHLDASLQMAGRTLAIKRLVPIAQTILDPNEILDQARARMRADLLRDVADVG